MTNNYFKVFHYLSVLGLCVDEKMFFFFDDNDAASVVQALHAAEQCLSTIGTLTFGRHAQMSVLKRLPLRPDIPQIGCVSRVRTGS